jgi:hypothetical protein
MINMDEFLDNWCIKDINIDDLVRFYEPFELKILLFVEDYTQDTDIMLENMLDYFLEYELYEFACVVRDEVNRRKLVKNNNKKKK